MEEHLRDLVQREFLSLDTDPRSPEQGQYGFVQGLIGEVAYATLSRRDRSAKHLVVARHLAALEDNELTAVVAFHYVEAHRAAPEGQEAAPIAAGARDWLSRAGRRALSLGSPEQALALFEQDLEMTESGPERGGLLELAGQAAEFASIYDRAAALFEEAIDYYEATGDANAVARTTVGLARVLEDIVHFSDEIARLERVFRALGDGADEHVKATLACELARCADFAGTYQCALEWSETALAIAERLDDIAPLARSIGARSYALFNLGRHQEAVILARGRVVFAEASGSLFDQTNAWTTLSLFIFDENPREALSAAMKASELARRAGHRGFEAVNLLNAAEKSLFLGEWGDTRAAIAELRSRELHSVHRELLTCTEALLTALTGDTAEDAPYLAKYVDRLAASEEVAVRATYLQARALMSLATGDIDAARRAAAEAVSVDPVGINSPRALAIQARAALWLHDIDGARAALAGMKAFRGRWMTAARIATEAGLAALEGRVEQASQAYREAIEAWRTLECPLDLALCELDLELLVGPDHLDATVAKEAREIFTELGAKPFLERLDQATGLAGAN